MTTTGRALPPTDAFYTQVAMPDSHWQQSRPTLARAVPLLRPDWLPESVWPFQTFGVKVDGSVLAVTDVGEGPALLFVHTGFWSFIWRDVITRLAADFRCVCFDSPGTGRSARVPKGMITLEGASRAVAGVVDALDLQNFTLVAHDLGGPASLAAVARTPKQVRAIAAVNAFAWRPSGKAFRGMLRLMGSAPMREFDAWTQMVPRISASNFGAGRHLDPPSRRAFLSGIGRSGVRTFHGYMHNALRCDDLYQGIARAMAGPLRSLPVLTVFGEYNDPLGFQPTWKKLYPDAKQVIVPKGNHFPMCDNPELVAEAIRTWYRETVEPRG